MFAFVGYPCIRNNFVETLIDPKMIAWETVLSVAILAVGIIGLTTLFPHYPSVAYTLIVIGSASTSIAILRMLALKCVKISSQTGQDPW